MVTAGGAETLPFLASFCVLPASLAFFVLYGKLVRGSRALILQQCNRRGSICVLMHRCCVVSAASTAVRCVYKCNMYEAIMPSCAV